MGVDFAKASLAAGNAVVATGRNVDAVAKAVGQAEDLLVVKLDVTSPANFYAGYFEELTPEQIEQQLAAGRTGYDQSELVGSR
jgi:NAD(P)-dependent dehydrogenase (short-subunit alcohol dehydrogenase family)